MIAFLKRLILRYGFGLKATPYAVSDNDWHEHSFFTAGLAKNERLAAIARERTALKEKLSKAIRDKKARAPIYLALRKLSAEELRIEAGK
jgi:hypothetical protein